MLRRGEVWREASIHPKAGDFPRALLSFHDGYGFVVPCWEHERSWSDFLVAGDEVSAPLVEIQLGGQALERWPRQLFVPEGLAIEAFEWFLASGEQKRDLHCVRIDRFPRQTVWQGREARETWERSRQSLDESDA